MHELQINDLKVEVVRKNIKNLHLAVYPPDGRVRVAAPLDVDDDEVRLYTISKLAWIQRRQKKIVNQSRQSQREFVSGESHYVEGKRFRLNVMERDAPGAVEVENNNTITMYVRDKLSLQQKRNVMQRWYRARLKVKLDVIVPTWAEKMEVEVEEWKIKQMKTKWGSCNIEEKRIWFNLDLAQKPVRCIEYVTVHELAHFLERNHNEIFVAHLDRFLPNWRELREELNQVITS